ncbi:MAG: c-type cytochrome, partial [Ignavibacteriales bacterium]
TGLAVFLLREVSSIAFEKEPPEKPGYAIAVAEGAGGEGGAAAEAPIDWGTVLPTANIEQGKAISAKCASCHNFDQGGPNGTGPNLFGVVGRKPGSHPGFAYSPAMTDFGSKNPAWDYEHLNAFLSGPQKYISGTKMTFVGLKKPEDRIAIIAYLHSLGSTLPIPAPNPAAAAAPAAPAGAAPAGGQTGSPASGGTAGSAAGQPLPGGAAGQPTAGAAQAPTQTEAQTPAKPSKPAG